jgi:hypothetical protein
MLALVVRLTGVVAIGEEVKYLPSLVAASSVISLGYVR